MAKRAAGGEQEGRDHCIYIRRVSMCIVCRKCALNPIIWIRFTMLVDICIKLFGTTTVRLKKQDLVGIFGPRPQLKTIHSC